MSDVRARYLTAAQTALDLLVAEAVAERWEDRSALEGFTVGGLAAHAASQILVVRDALDTDVSGKEVVGLFDHFRRAAWVAEPIDNDANTAIRQGGQSDAAAGHAEVLAEAVAALAVLRERLPGMDGGAASGNPRWAYATSLDDFLATRIMEIVVHCDDLAVSVGVATPVFDQEVFDTAVWMLGRLSAARHGQPALVRALARSERAPAVVAAL